MAQKLKKLDDPNHEPELNLDEYFSTHPLHKQRALHIEEHLPTFMSLRSSCKLCEKIPYSSDPLKSARVLREINSFMRLVCSLMI